MKSFHVIDFDKKNVTFKKKKNKKLQDKMTILSKSKHNEDLDKCMKEMKKKVKKKKNCFVVSGNKDMECSKDNDECAKRKTSNETSKYNDNNCAIRKTCEPEPELFENLESKSSNSASSKHKKKKKKTSLLSQNIEPEPKFNQNETSEDNNKCGKRKTCELEPGPFESIERTNSNDASSKHKKKKKTSLLSQNIETVQNFNQNETTDLKIIAQDSIRKKKQKNYLFHKSKARPFNQDNYIDEKPKTKKKKLLNVTNDEYKPGMLSDMIQIKKYGRVIIPWDPSFGLDPTYKIPDNDGGGPKLKINPLFDLSKRKKGAYSIEGNTQNAIFVGNLPNDTGINALKKYFSTFGLILQAKLRCKKFKTSKNIDGIKRNVQESNQNASIKFSNFESCKAALKMNGELYKGHHLRVTLAKDEGNSDPNKSIFIGNLAFKAKDDDLWKAFEDCGAIESVRVVRDGNTGKGRGFGYINFKSSDSLEKALKQDGMTILDRDIRVRRNDSDARSLSNSVTVKRKRWKRFTPGVKPGNNEPSTKTTKQKMNPEKISNENLSSENTEQFQDSQDQESNSKRKTHKKKKKLLMKNATNQLSVN